MSRRVSISGTGVGSIVTANIADNAVTLAKLATQATHTVLANVTGSTASPTASTTLALAQYAADANGSAAAPTFLVEPSGNSGLYWDATKGVVTSVDAVDRIIARVSGLTEISSGVAGTVGVEKLTNTAGSASTFVYTATPEGAITGTPGDRCLDITNGRSYLKRTGSGNTGWVQIDRCESGTYTPTGTIVSNLDSVTPGVFTYLRVGDIVSVFGDVSYDPTAASNVQLAISLPLASNFTSAGDLSGSGGAWGCRATADTTNDRAAFTINNSVTSATAAALNFQYRVL